MNQTAAAVIVSLLITAKEEPTMNKPSPTFLGLRTAIYHAPDISKAKTWYSTVLGIEPYFDEPFYVGFNVGGFELGLDPGKSSTPGDNTGVIVYWGVPKLELALERLAISWGSSKTRNSPSNTDEPSNVSKHELLRSRRLLLIPLSNHPLIL